MWFHSLFRAVPVSPRPPSRRLQHLARRRLAARRLLLEGLEDRRLMAFNVLAQYATGPSPSDLALAQINSGNQLDLVIANNASNSGSVQLGNSDGTFNTPQSTGVESYSITTGDLTGDGITDLISTNTAVLLQTGNGDGTFQPPQSISLPPQIAPGNPDPSPLPQSLLSVTTGDLNADGKLDLVVGGATSFSVYYRRIACGYYSCGYTGVWRTFTDGYVNVLIGNGSGGFDAPPQVHALGRDQAPAAITIADLNDDGNADVLTANNNNLSTLLSDSTGALQAPLHSGSGSRLRSISLGDFDGDGHLDTFTHWGNSLRLQFGQANGSFEPGPSVYMYMNHPVDSAVVGDVNGDGKLDLVAVGSVYTCHDHGYYGCYDGTYSGHASVVLGNGQGSFSLPIASPLGTDFDASFVDVALADLNGDGLSELVAIERQTGVAIVAHNDGNWVEPVALSISSPTVVEGNDGTVDAVFHVTLSAPSPKIVSVDFATEDLNDLEQYWYGGLRATADVDYRATMGTLTIPAGQTQGTISVPVNGDRVGETNELFFLNLSNPSYANISEPRAIATILDDEPVVSMDYYSDPAVQEGNAGTTTMTFQLVLSNASDVPVSVDFFTSDGSALSGSDYIPTTGTVTFAAGETTQTLSVQVIGDTLQENDEYFTVNLTAATNASIGNALKYGYILNDDAPPRISISDASVLEGNSGTQQVTFVVSLTSPSGDGVWVNYSTANGTATVRNGDYVATSGTIYFEPGETSKMITVTIKGDTKKENDERFYVNLSGAVGAAISDSRGEGTILNDDGGGTKRKSASVQRAAPLDAEDTLIKARKRR